MLFKYTFSFSYEKEFVKKKYTIKSCLKSLSLCGSSYMLQKKIKGSLEVVCGPMFSGKSDELIRRLRRAKIARQRVIVFKHRIDNRYTVTNVASHDGTTIEAHAVGTAQEIKALVQKGLFDVVGFDEVQFFPQDIVSLICSFVEEGKRVIAAGLDLDFRGEPFGCMPVLLAIADTVHKLQAICCVCGQEAHFTQRLVNGNPAKYDDPIILVGAQEAYQARCRNCYAIDKIATPVKQHGQKQNTL
jgi:thymidine kinase